MSVPAPVISIGSGDRALSYGRTLQVSTALAVWDNPYQYAAYGVEGSTIQVVTGGRSVSFSFDSASGTYVNQSGTGEMLTGSGSNWTFAGRDGTVIQMDRSDYDPAADDYRYDGPSVLGVAHSITFPNKEKLTLTYTSQGLVGTRERLTLNSVQSSSGYMVKFDGDTVTLLNAAVDYCTPGSGSCTYSKTWPSLTFTTAGTSTQTLTVTDELNRFTVYTLVNGIVHAIRRPSSSTDDTMIDYVNGRVASITTDGRTWNYSWSLAAPLMTATVTNPDGTSRTYVTDTTLNVLKSEQDEANHTTSYTYDTKGRLTDVTYPEGNKAHYVYDSRGNVTEKRLISKTAGSPADIVISASYSSTCANALTCNKPITTTDARGKVTNYSYDSAHGGVRSITRPAPSTGAVRPQTRYDYTALQAYYKSSSGSIAASGQPTYVLTSVSECQTTASCVGAADEVKTTIGYGPQSAGTANNLLPISMSSGAGDGSLSIMKSVTYDHLGNVTYVDGPLPGTGDTTRLIYDAASQLRGQIGPDPDGSSNPLPNRAMRMTYNQDGQVTKLERGTTAGQTDANWTTFSPAEVVDIGYDPSGRETTRKLSRDGTAYALTQSSYDANGRPLCSAIRMNTGAFGALPVSACMLGTAGADGADRISQISYDAAGRPNMLQEGVGTGDVRTERALTYTNNGQVQTLKDGDGNLTTYSYDGFDRLLKTQYPNKAQGAGTSSTTDYEQLTYDPNSNVTSRRLRDATTIGYAYDDLNRLHIKDLPATEPDVTYEYDNLGRLTSASQTGNNLSFAYDALSRLTDETGPQGTVQSDWYEDGTRKKITYPGVGLYVNYDYLVTGDIQKIRENGAAAGVGVLATYGYDNLGNLTSLTYGNGVVQNYTPDPVSRLQTLTLDLPGTASDLTIGGATTPVTYNAASQITSAPRSNDLYSYGPFSSVAHDFVANGLNQYISNSSGGTTNTLLYDDKGNLTSDGAGNSYCYSSENLLMSSGGTCALPTIALNYDPMLRLYQVAGSSMMRFAYDRLNLIADYDGSNNLLHRYVFGPGIDQPIVEYAGSGTADRTFLSGDERGSIVSRTDSSGALVTANKYDEYGIPGSANSGLFQYTGQAWISQLGMYYYKARIYSPTLGRFMQTDPTGYADGSNWYAYVGDEPINARDPLGLGCNDLAVPPDGIPVTASCPGGLGAGAGSYNGGSSGGEPSCVGSPGCKPIEIKAAHIKKNRKLNQEEICLFHNAGFGESFLKGVTIHPYVPIAVKMINPSADGYTPDANNVFLEDSSNALTSAGQAGLIGHELNHAWEFRTGALNIYKYLGSEAVNGYNGDPYEQRSRQWQRFIVNNFDKLKNAC